MRSGISAKVFVEWLGSDLPAWQRAWMLPVQRLAGPLGLIDEIDETWVIMAAAN
jgi:hypothetical protein